MVAQYGYFDGELHQESLKDGETITLASLMGAHEFGQGDLPSRPVFKRTGYQLISKLPDDIKPLAKSMLISALKGKISAVDFLEKVGNLAKSATQSNFGANNTIGLKPNSRTTERNKGRNDPLVESSELRDKMSVRVK